MKKIILLFNLLLTALVAKAQVSVTARIDSLQLLVGEQTGLTLEVACNANQRVQMPPFQAGVEVLPNIEVVKVLPIDTTMLNDGKRMQLSQKYILTAWDSSLYYLPPLEVQVGGKIYETKSLALKVYTMDVDTLHFDRYFGPKDEMKPIFSWSDWRLVVWLSLLLVVLVVAAIVMYVSLRTGKPILQIVRRKPKKPAHEVALQEIERIKAERTWAQEDSKAYYTQLTETLRTYIQDRYGFSAMEMTSGEIIERLTQENDEEALNELRNLFQTADLVKFAKHVTMINENDANLMTALEYVQQTKKEEDPQAAEPIVEVTPEQKRKRAYSLALGIFIAVACVASVCILGWIAYRVYDLLM